MLFNCLFDCFAICITIQYSDIFACKNIHFSDQPIGRVENLPIMLKTHKSNASRQKYKINKSLFFIPRHRLPSAQGKKQQWFLREEQNTHTHFITAYDEKSKYPLFC